MTDFRGRKRFGEVRLSVHRHFTRREAMGLSTRVWLRDIRCELMPLAGRFRLVARG